MKQCREQKMLKGEEFHYVSAADDPEGFGTEGETALGLVQKIWSCILFL